MGNSASTDWPINERGELVVELGVGTQNVATRLPEGWIPTNPVTGKPVIRLPDSIARSTNNVLPVLLLGGDHNYQQHYGTTGKNGLNGMYRDLGLTPYIAVNNPSVSFAPGNGYGSHETGGLSWPQIAELSAAGAEIVGHGIRHPSDWQRISTGILIRYGTGLGTAGAAAATVAVSATGLTLTGNGGAEDVVLTFAAYPTLGQLVAAIVATPGWWAQLAPELDGTEASSNMLPLMTARNIKATNNAYTRYAPMGQYFAASGGLMVWATGTNDDTYFAKSGVNFTGFVNGIYVMGGDLSTMTLTQFKALIDGAAIPNLLCYLMDNGGANTRENYIQGDEIASAIYPFSGIRCQGTPGYMEAGLPHQYVIRRIISKCVETAAANGVTIRHFAEAGAYLEPNTLRDMEKIDSVRNQGYAVINPMARPLAYGHAYYWSAMTATLAQYGTPERKTALLEALVTSGPWVVDCLMHSLLVDGGSPYPLLSTGAGDADQTESQWYPFLQQVAAKVASGAVRQMSPTQLAGVRALAPMPKNLFFNPRLINCGETLTGVTANNGTIIPGWLLRTSPAITACAIADGKMTYTGNGTTIALLRQDLYLEPGATYEVGFELRINSNSAGAVQLSHATMYSTQRGNKPTTSQFSRNGMPYGSVGKYSVRQLIQAPLAPVDTLPMIQGLIAEPYNLSTNNSLTVSLDTFGNVVVNAATGAVSAAAVTAKEVAAAINAAIAATAGYPAEYHNAASAVSGKVVIRSPYAYYSSYESDQSVVVQGGGAGTAPRLIFGGLNGSGIARPKLGVAGGETYLTTVQINTSITGQAEIGSFYCRKVDNR